ncbi:MAG: nitrous oxide-stimulated promoter family protein [Anaerolineaceae bacterium]|nr:nitrous oxide-stimulated promoter family protein [Anaerolineaceae bacterium]
MKQTSKQHLSHIEHESLTVQKMITLYCKKNHKSKSLCESCSSLNDYASKRLKHCRYGENKTFCTNCSTHCYAPGQREKIRAVMRFSGPRMIFVDPVLAIKHLIQLRLSNRKNPEK